MIDLKAFKDSVPVEIVLGPCPGVLSGTNPPSKKKTRLWRVLFGMARLERFELPTARFVAEYSIQLSYRRII